MKTKEVVNGVACPFCGCTRSTTEDTKHVKFAVRRLRKCVECEAKYHSFEMNGPHVRQFVETLQNALK